jgi:hypothetical protein
MNATKYGLLTTSLDDDVPVLLLPNGVVVVVDSSESDSQLRVRYGLDRVVHSPERARATCVDGPLAGWTLYCGNVVGFRVQVVRDDESDWYQLESLASQDEPARLRFVEQV